MKRFQLSKVSDEERIKKLHFEQPLLEHCTKEYSKPGIYCVGDEPIVIMGKANIDEDRILWALKTIKYANESRTTGTVYRTNNKIKVGESRVFGFQPRVGISQNFCRVASLALESPQQHGIFLELGHLLATEYRKHAEEKFEKQRLEVRAKVREDWIVPGTPFTSGIANKNNNLKYHFDGHNVSGVFSCMLVLRKDIAGGELQIPGFDARFIIPNGHYILFDGHSALNGVTKIHKTINTSYRYSIVYYALQAMCQCLDRKGELARLQDLKCKAQRKRAEQSALRNSKLQKK